MEEMGKEMGAVLRLSRFSLLKPDCRRMFCKDAALRGPGDVMVHAGSNGGDAPPHESLSL
jgi:hypothetical protein